MALLVAIACTKASCSDLGSPSRLRVENLFPEVAVLSERRPRFSFVPPAAPAGAFNTLQSSYRITVSNGKTNVWDSGDVASDATAQIEVRKITREQKSTFCLTWLPKTKTATKPIRELIFQYIL